MIPKAKNDALDRRSPVISGPIPKGCETLLSPAALAFVSRLHGEFAPRIAEALERRDERRKRWQLGGSLQFLPETAKIREADWRGASIPDDLRRRHVEITGPVDRKMIVNALNSGADCFMADFEDSSAPTWHNMLSGQLNLYDAIRRQIDFHDPAKDKWYRLSENPATLLVRPRGLHLEEAHFRIDGKPVPASLVDFGLYFFHNAAELLRRGSGPYFYLPKLESHLEARIWNDVFTQAQSWLNIPQGSVRATVLIETLPAAFEMDEILYELREHSAGLNCGRWDYIFSYIKVHRWDASRVLPDRGQVTMEQPFMRAYTQLAIKTCHRRGVHAMGGMAAQIPIKNDPEANAAAMNKVRSDKLREAKDGHDGTWVAHPALVPIAREIFTASIDGDHQIARTRDDVEVTAEQLLACPDGTKTLAGLKQNLRIGVQYLQAWLKGVGCVPLEHLMEDAATAEISRTQVSQWLRHRVQLEDGRTVDAALIKRVLNQEMEALRLTLGEDRYFSENFGRAASMFAAMCLDTDIPEFLTTAAYETLVGGSQDR